MTNETMTEPAYSYRELYAAYQALLEEREQLFGRLAVERQINSQLQNRNNALEETNANLHMALLRSEQAETVHLKSVTTEDNC